MLLNGFLAIRILLSISRSDLASCDMMLPKYTKLLACFILVLQIIILQIGDSGFFEATTIDILPLDAARPQPACVKTAAILGRFVSRSLTKLPQGEIASRRHHAAVLCCIWLYQQADNRVEATGNNFS